MTLEEHLNDWLDLRRLAVKPRTIEHYEGLITRHIVPALGSCPVEDLTPAMLTHLLAGICAAGHGRTAEAVYVLLRCALPEKSDKIMRPRFQRRTVDPWSDEDMAVYLAALDGHRHELPLSLALLLGLRRGEICGLLWSDIDLVDKVIHIQRQQHPGIVGYSSPKSSSSVRTLPIPTYLLPKLDNRSSVGKVCHLTPSGLDQAHRALVQKLGLPPLTLHGLRHTMATAVIRHGGDMRSLQLLLGHASYTTTAHMYTHPDAAMLAGTVDTVTLGVLHYQGLFRPFQHLTLNQGVQGSSP